MWLFYFFLNKTASAVRNACLSSNNTGTKYSRLAYGNTRYFTTYPKVDNFLVKKYATN